MSACALLLVSRLLRLVCVLVSKEVQDIHAPDLSWQVLTRQIDVSLTCFNINNNNAVDTANLLLFLHVACSCNLRSLYVCVWLLMNRLNHIM